MQYKTKKKQIPNQNLNFIKVVDFVGEFNVDLS